MFDLLQQVVNILPSSEGIRTVVEDVVIIHVPDLEGIGEVIQNETVNKTQVKSVLQKGLQPIESKVTEVVKRLPTWDKIASQLQAIPIFQSLKKELIDAIKGAIPVPQAMDFPSVPTAKDVASGVVKAVTEAIKFPTLERIRDAIPTAKDIASSVAKAVTEAIKFPCVPTVKEIDAGINFPPVPTVESIVGAHKDMIKNFQRHENILGMTTAKDIQISKLTADVRYNCQK